MNDAQRAEALRLADALTGVDTPCGILNENCEDAAALLRVLAAVPAEPVAWQWLNTGNYRKTLPSSAVRDHWRPLYAAPHTAR